MTKTLTYLFGWLMPFLRWLKPSFEGTDGKAEEVKLGGWAVLGLILWTVKHIISLGAAISMTHIYLLAVLLIFYLLLNGVVKFQEIIEAVKNIKRDSTGNITQ